MSALEESAACAAEVRRCYGLANPEKVASGEVDGLLAKYAGQEKLLLRRVRYRYGVASRAGRLGVRQARGGGWIECDAELRADGFLAWAGPGAGAVDARSATATATAAAAAGAAARDEERPFSFTLSRGGGSAPLALAARDDADRAAWLEELAGTRSFFERLEREKAAQRAEASAIITAIDASAETLEADRERASDLTRREESETRRSLARSERDLAVRAGGAAPPGDVPSARAALEAALDDALVRATEAADLEKAGKNRKAHAAYAKAVKAFVGAKASINAMPPPSRPERDVLNLIGSGAAQCRAAADACAARGRASKPRPPDSPESRARPRAVEKILLDSGDV